MYDFASRPTESLADQCRMQAREYLDPEMSAFMEAVADRLSALAVQAAMQDVAAAFADQFKATGERIAQVREEVRAPLRSRGKRFSLKP